MTNAKSERLMNLFILLLNARNFVSRQHIRETIEGYRGQGDEAFQRMFERDKEELRQAGIPIVTGSNDPDSDEQDGYRVRRSDFELPPVEFTPDELAALGVARSVWQESVAAQQTAEALETLRAAGVEPDPLRLEVLRPTLAAEPGLDEFLTAIHDRRVVTFEYRAESRRVRPWRLQQRGGRWYLLGFDEARGDVRHFKLARITSAVGTVGRAGAFEPPDETTVESHLEVGPGDDAVRCVVAVRRGAGRDLTRGAAAAAWAEPLPAGFDAFEVRRPLLAGLVGEICAEGADAIALAPAEVRDAVIAQLRGLAGAAR